MTAIWALTAQSFMIFLGYCGALICGATFAALAIVNFARGGLTFEWNEVIEVTILAFSTAVAVIPPSLVPFGVAVALTEGFKLRGLVTYLVIGCVTGVLVVLPLREMISGLPYPPIDGAAMRLGIASSAVAGFVYWVIAGRTAGRWTELPWFERYPR